MSDEQLPPEPPPKDDRSRLDERIEGRRQQIEQKLEEKETRSNKS